MRKFFANWCFQCCHDESGEESQLEPTLLLRPAHQQQPFSSPSARWYSLAAVMPLPPDPEKHKRDVLLMSMLPASLEDEREFMVRTYSRVSEEEEEHVDEENIERRDECLLCLEGFSPPNHPKATSLCHCGMNKNAFHLPCLLVWRASASAGRVICPLCGEEIFFEDHQQQQDE
ncbi:hypothetical protein BASA81_001929 [Batrachochytrium salamandrivorans]|nr:hypothetical protein BASA81_001929 [Batrachochytrium salamandrivorans]